jgi:multiple sugar transport system permease protein
LPSELIDAARVDGATELQIFLAIIFPMLGPAITTLGIMTFLFSWNLFLWPLVVISSQGKFTAPLGLSLMGLGSTFLIDYHLWMAAATLAIIPPLLFFLILEKPYLRGLETLSGMK